MKNEGFCWNNVLNPKARLLKVKLKQASVNDVGSMSLMPIVKTISSYYIIALLNSNLIFDYYREFINCTVNIQINDIRQVPIIIPSDIQLERMNRLTYKAISLKKNIHLKGYNDTSSVELFEIERQIDELVLQLYGIKR